MSGYTALVERGERFWIVHVPEVERSTQARTLREVDDMARDLVHLMTGEPADTLNLTIQWPADVADAIDAFQRARAESERARARMEALAHEQAHIVARLVSQDHLPVRDVGALLDVSYQRVAQLAAKGTVDA
ncbi:MAG: hypothetical protein WAV90_23925 [Gordonia amarae]